MNRETDIDPEGSTEIDRVEAAGAESNKRSRGAGIHCVYGVPQMVDGDLCEILQHPQVERTEIAHHDATLKLTCQSLTAETLL